jgi:hypothetical protein
LLSAAARLCFADAALGAGVRSTAEELLDSAETDLGRESRLTIHKAWLFELRARLSGKGAEQAEEVYHRLGHVGREVAPGSEPESAINDRSPPVVDKVEEDEMSERLRITLVAVDGIPEQDIYDVIQSPDRIRRIKPGGWPFLKLVLGNLRERIPTRIIDALAADWMGPSEDLAAIFRGGSPKKGEPMRLLLDTDPMLSWLPWEFGSVFRNPDPLFLAPIRSQVVGRKDEGQERALINITRLLTRIKRVSKAIGAQQELTSVRDALRRQPRRESPMLLIVDTETVSRKSESGFAYLRLADIYKRQGVGHFHIDSEVDFERLQRVAADVKPDVILFLSTMIDSPSLPEPMLESCRLLPKMVSHIARLNRADRIAPTVIIDVPLPSSSQEEIHQMFARNRFAFELLRAGGVTSVVATGFGSVDFEFLIHEVLAKCIEERCGLDQTLDRIRRHWPGGESLRDALPFLGTAIFSNQPYQLLAPQITPNYARHGDAEA